MSKRVSQCQFLEGLDSPMPSGDYYLVSVDEEVSIRVGLFESLLPSEKTKGTIVLSHGYAEYMEKYAETVTDFLNLGYRVAMIEWRSHGCSGGRSDIYRDVLHFKDFDKMNKVYASYFPSDKLPSRTCIGVTGLAVGASVEIDFIAGC